MKRVVALALLGGLLFQAAAVRADDVRERLGALEQSLKELQAAQRDRGTSVSDAMTQAETVRSELQTLQGAIDGVAQQLRLYMEEVNRFRQDIDQRLSAIEEQLSLGARPAGGSSSLLPPPTISGPATAGGATAAAGNESLAYQKALGMVHGGDYLNGSRAFQQFIQTYPKSGLAANAQYWIGECYYALKDYQKAIKEYQTVVERYPRHEKVNAALLKQGYAFEALGMAEESRLFLQKVVTRAPESPEAKKAVERLKAADSQRAKYGPPAAPGGGARPTAVPAAKPAPADHQGIPLAPGVQPGQESLRTPMPAVAEPAPKEPRAP